MRIEQESAQDFWEVEALYDLAFGPGRESLSSYRLRDGVAPVPELSLLIRDTGAVVAAIRYWPVQCQGHPVLLLGPIAVHTTRQGEGLGAWLMAESLDRATHLGWDRVLLVGDAPYYQRFGFRKLAGVGMPPPTNPDRILGRELTDGAWDGLSGQIEKAAEGARLPPSWAGGLE